MEKQEQTLETQQVVNNINKKVFITRLVIYIMCGLIIPASFLIWKFNLFSNVSKTNIGGWGIVVIILTAVFLSKLAKQSTDVIESETARQAVDAFRKVLLPLLAVTLCLYAVGDFWQQLIQFFVILTIFEPIAYVANPMPQYVKQVKDEKKKNKIIELFNIFWGEKNK